MKGLRTMEHTDIVRTAVFSPDGKLVITGSDDKTAQIWEVESGRKLRTLIGHTTTIQLVAFSQDGKKIVTCGSNEAHVWEVESGKKLQELKWDVEVQELVRSGARGSHLLHFVVRFGHPVSFSPDGKTIITAGGDIRGERTILTPAGLEVKGEKVEFAHIWDVASGKRLRTLTGDRICVRSGSNSLTFSPDGRKILTASLDEVVRIWSAVSGQEMQKWEWCNTEVNGTRIRLLDEDRKFKFRTTAFSPDGKKFVAISDDGIIIWDVESEMVLQTLNCTHARYASHIAISPDGNKIIAISEIGGAIWFFEGGMSEQAAEARTGIDTLRREAEQGNPIAQHNLG